jgi:hypothetical protein
MSALPSNNFVNYQPQELQQANAYVLGMVEHLKDEWDREDFDEIDQIKELLHRNIKSSLAYINEIVAVLQQQDICPKSIYISGKSLIRQHVLISLCAADQHKSRFEDIYRITSAIEKDSRSANYRLSFTFTFDNGQLNEEVLSCAGYLQVAV